eukprot:4839562-Prymnesium_polylepis.1
MPTCSFPSGAEEYAVITSVNAILAAHTIYNSASKAINSYNGNYRSYVVSTIEDANWDFKVTSRVVPAVPLAVAVGAVSVIQVRAPDRARSGRAHTSHSATSRRLLRTQSTPGPRPRHIM